MNEIPRQNRSIVEGVLAEYKGQQIRFHPNPGNAGDSLIAYATRAFFKRAQIGYEEIGLSDVGRGATIVLGGGGNLIPQYDAMKKAIEFYAPIAKRLILLPHTIRGNEEVLHALPSSALIFCREVTSYKHVLDVNPKCEVVLAHDMAFHVDEDDAILAADERAGVLSEFHKRIARTGLSLEQIRNLGSIVYAREDEESAKLLENSDFDLSSVSSFGVWGKDAARSAWIFLACIRNSNLIKTDRLHVAIASAILGKQCVMYDNSYGKNSDIFEHSLRTVPCVQFVRHQA